jgi:glycosyltransferase involved in cell wall biosynthesis
VDPLNPRAIAGSIQWLLEHADEAAEMGRRGREAVLTRYNWETEAARLIEMYRKLLGGPPALKEGAPCSTTHDRLSTIG